jgi:hypothetical protein
MNKLTMMALVITAATTVGCKKKDATATDKGAEPAKAGDLPKLTADPDPGAITPSEKPPFESVKFRQLDKRSEKGWPDYDAYNLGTKPIKFMAIYGYAYDATGKQVGRTKVPMSWNGEIAPGKKSDWSISIGGMDDLPAGAASFDVCFDSIKLGDDAAPQDDKTRCPEQKPKNK